MFYQIYCIVTDLINWISRVAYRCFKKTKDEIDERVGLFG